MAILLMAIVVILLMAIRGYSFNAYFINGYCGYFTNAYFINGYYGYSINGYWLLFYK
jgi:hypothetical protein